MAQDRKPKKSQVAPAPSEGSAASFQDSAAKLRKALSNKENSRNKEKDVNVENDNDFAGASELLKDALFTKKVVTGIIDDFIRENSQGKQISKEGVEHLYKRVVEELHKNDYVDEKTKDSVLNPTRTDRLAAKYKNFAGIMDLDEDKDLHRVKFNQAVNTTYKMLKDKTPNLSLKDRIFYNISMFCGDLGLKTLSASCMTFVSKDNREKLADINNSISKGFDKVLGSVKKTEVVGAFTKKILEERSNRLNGVSDRQK